MKEGSLEDLELYVYTLRHAVVDCLSDSRDRREGDGAQGDEAMEGADSARAMGAHAKTATCLEHGCRGSRARA